MSSSFAHRLVIGLCILYLVAIAVMWWVGGKYAARQTEELLQSAQKDLIVTLNDYLDHLLVANALKIIDKCGTYEVAAQSDLDEFRFVQEGSM